MSYSYNGFDNDGSTTFVSPPAGAEDGVGGDPIDKVKYQFSGLNDGSQGMGVSVTGRVTKADGTPLNGSASINVSGEVRQSAGVSGIFITSTSPPGGVSAGENTSAGGFTFEFDPDPAGLSFSREIGAGENDIGSVQYGLVEGAVRDYNGDPVEGVGVSSSGAQATTGPDGTYEFNSPGGLDVTLSAVGVDKGVVPTGGEVNTLDFQYAALSVSVVLPTGTGVSGAKASYPGAEKGVATDSTGEALFVRVPLNRTDTLSIFGGDVTREVSSNGEGDLTQEIITLGAGFEGSLSDAVTGGSAENVPVRAVGERVGSSFSRTDGTFAVGTTSTGELTLEVGKDDPRYNTVAINATLTEGDVDTEEIELERSENIGTAI